MSESIIEWIQDPPPAVGVGSIEDLMRKLSSPGAHTSGQLGVSVTSPECMEAPGFESCLQDLEALATQRCEGSIGPGRPNDAGYNSLQDCVAQETFKEATSKCLPLCLDYLAKKPKQPGGGGGTPKPPDKCHKWNWQKGKFEPVTCPDGQECDPDTGDCKPPEDTVATTSKRKTNWGLFLLGAAAVAAGVLAWT